MFRFEVDMSGPVWEGALLYDTKECWFEFHCSLTGPANPVGWREIGSLAVHTLEINVEVDSCRLLWVVGWYPILPKHRGHLPLPRCEHGCVKLVTDRELIPGAPYGLGGAERWRPTHDPDTRWICIGEVKAPPGADWVEFATNTVAVISQGELVALWLHPEFVSRSAQVAMQRSAGAAFRRSLRAALSNVARTLRRMGRGSDDS